MPRAMARAAGSLSSASSLLGVLALGCGTALAQLTVGCPNRGCGPGQQYHLTSTAGAAARLPEALPHLAWTWRTKASHGEGFPQCTVAEQGEIVCTGNLTGGLGGIVSLSTNGTQQWLDVTLDATQASPVLSTTGDAISCDGRALVGTQADGKPIGPPVPLFMPGVYSLDLTAESIIPLVARYNFDCTPSCGELVTWLADGVPHASASMNDSQTGEPFTAAAMPLINVANKTQDSTTRIYIVTAAVHTVSALHQQEAEVGALVPCRVEAWDVASTMNNRLEQAWYFPFYCEPPDWRSKTSAPLPTMLLNNTVVLGGSLSADDEAVNVLAVSDDGPAPRLVSVTPLGTRGVVSPGGMEGGRPAAHFSSTVASLSFQPETGLIWATERGNRSTLLGFRLAPDSGETNSSVVAYPLQQGESVVSPVMSVAASTGEPALLFLVASPGQPDSSESGAAFNHAFNVQRSIDVIAARVLSSAGTNTRELWRATLLVSATEAQGMVRRFGSVGQPLLIDRSASGSTVVVATESAVFGLSGS